MITQQSINGVNKMDISKLYITKDLCVGDRYHNDYIDILINHIDINECNEIILKAFEKNWHTGYWVYDSYTKEELRRLNTIMRTKDKNTLLKRIENFINYIGRGTPYTVMLNRNKIEHMLEVLEKFAIKWKEAHNG